MVIKWIKKLAAPKPAETIAPVEPAAAVFKADRAVVAEPVAPATPAPRPGAAITIPQEKIAQRAYELWIARGRPVGSGAADWLAAEAELKAEYATGTDETLPHRSR